MKKNAKKILLLFLCTALLIGCVPVASVALTTDTGLEYTVSDTAVTITAYSGEDTTVEVPATLNGLPVTTIAAGAFSYKTQLEKVTLPETVTDIQMMAFFGLENLTDVNLESLTSLRHIGAYAFIGTKLSGALTLPESVEEIGLRNLIKIQVLCPEGVVGPRVVEEDAVRPRGSDDHGVGGAAVL